MGAIDSNAVGTIPSKGLIGAMEVLSTVNEARLSRDIKGSPGKHSKKKACMRPIDRGNAITVRG
jgi:hypothetical protein